MSCNDDDNLHQSPGTKKTMQSKYDKIFGAWGSESDEADTAAIGKWVSGEYVVNARDVANASSSSNSKAPEEVSKKQSREFFDNKQFLHFDIDVLRARKLVCKEWNRRRGFRDGKPVPLSVVKLSIEKKDHLRFGELMKDSEKLKDVGFDVRVCMIEL